MEKQRMLLLPKSFIESYLQDLDNEDRLEIMSVVFNWYMELEPLPIKSKLVKVLFNNLLPILEGHKMNYVNGAKGGAPKGNNNAKKTTYKTTETTPLVLENNHKTTPLVLENNHKTTPLENINKPKEKEKEKEKEKDKENKKIKEKDNNIFDLDIYSKEALDEADKILTLKGWK
jgi:hypothetical protein